MRRPALFFPRQKNFIFFGNFQEKNGNCKKSPITKELIFFEFREKSTVEEISKIVFYVTLLFISSYETIVWYMKPKVNLGKISFFGFLAKFRYFTEISIFDQSVNFSSKFRFLTKISVIRYNFDIRVKF